MSDMGDIPHLAEPRDLDERIAAAFAKPVENGQLVPMPATNLAISDAIITAQKVAVERDEAKVLQKIRVFAQAAGSDWFYRYPVGRGAAQTWIEGPSIKCANNVARYYGNCQVDTRVVDNGDSWVIYARFVDYETGFSYTRPFQQRKGQQSIKTADQGRALDIALQIGVSKAIRNVVCNALETFTNYAFEEAKGAIVDKIGKDLARYRDRVVARLNEIGILVRVEAMAGRAAKDWLAPDIAKVIAQLQAINDGMATVDETWPAGQPEAKTEQTETRKAADPRQAPPLREKSEAQQDSPAAEPGDQSQPSLQAEAAGAGTPAEAAGGAQAESAKAAIACTAPQGKCRYAGCEEAGHCLAGFASAGGFPAPQGAAPIRDLYE